jgi:hypothetical protein
MMRGGLTSVIPLVGMFLLALPYAEPAQSVEVLGGVEPVAGGSPPGQRQSPKTLSDSQPVPRHAERFGCLTNRQCLPLFEHADIFRHPYDIGLTAGQIFRKGYESIKLVEVEYLLRNLYCAMLSRTSVVFEETFVRARIAYVIQVIRKGAVELRGRYMFIAPVPLPYQVGGNQVVR